MLNDEETKGGPKHRFLISMLQTLISCHIPFIEDIGALPQSFLSFGNMNVTRAALIRSVMIAPSCLSEIILPPWFANSRFTLQDPLNQSSSEFKSRVCQAMLKLTRLIENSKGSEQKGIIILSLLDTFTFCQGKMLDPRNISRAVRFIATILDEIVKNSPFKIVIMTPYIHKKKEDLAELIYFETNLFHNLCLDQDLSCHIFKRIRFFSIIKCSMDYNVTDPFNIQPDSPLPQTLLEYNQDRVSINSFGFEFISYQLSQMICSWCSTIQARIPKLKLTRPLNFSAKMVRDLVPQTSGPNQMILDPKKQRNSVLPRITLVDKPNLDHNHSNPSKTTSTPPPPANVAPHLSPPIQTSNNNVQPTKKPTNPPNHSLAKNSQPSSTSPNISNPNLPSTSGSATPVKKKRWANRKKNRSYIRPYPYLVPGAPTRAPRMPWTPPSYRSYPPYPNARHY